MWLADCSATIQSEGVKFRVIVPMAHLLTRIWEVDVGELGRNEVPAIFGEVAG